MISMTLTAIERLVKRIERFTETKCLDFELSADLSLY